MVALVPFLIALLLGALPFALLAWGAAALAGRVVARLEAGVP